MTKSHFFLLPLAVLGLVLLAAPAQASSDEAGERIVQSRTVRCGYADWPPFIHKDPRTQKVSGLLKDIWEEIGRRLDLTIVWELETGWGDINAAVNARKIDLFCAGGWHNAGRLTTMLASRPLFYNALYLYARADDRRFDNHYDRANVAGITVSGQEGDDTATLLNTLFPQVHHFDVAPDLPQDNMFMNVMTRKADLTINDPTYAKDYMKANPGRLRQVDGQPAALMPTSLLMAPHEYRLKAMLDTVIGDLIDDGTLARLIREQKVEATWPPASGIAVNLPPR